MTAVLKLLATLSQPPKGPGGRQFAVVRKTRISFELHPSLLLEDLFLDNHDLVAEEEDDDNVHMIEMAYLFAEELRRLVINTI